jgi:hypothetical protein
LICRPWRRSCWVVPTELFLRPGIRREESELVISTTGQYSTGFCVSSVVNLGHFLLQISRVGQTRNWMQQIWKKVTSSSSSRNVFVLFSYSMERSEMKFHKFHVLRENKTEAK